MLCLKRHKMKAHQPSFAIPTTALRARWLPPTKFYGIRFRHQNSRTRTRFFFFFFFCQGRPERKSVHRRLYPRRGDKCAHNPQWANEPLEQQRTLLCWACLPLVDDSLPQRSKPCANPRPWTKDARVLTQKAPLPPPQRFLSRPLSWPSTGETVV